MQKEADTVPDPDVETMGGGGGSGHTDLGISVSCECHVTLSYISYFFSYCVSYLGNYTRWTRKYFTYCFKFYIFVLHLILFHLST